MFATHRTILIALFVCFVSPGLAAESYAFENATVISMMDGLPNVRQTVVVRGDSIVAVGQSLDIPDDAVVIDASGKFIIPGLADMHGHIGADYLPGEGGDRADLLLYLASGVTTVRNAVGSPAQLQLASDIAAGQQNGPRLFTASELLEGEKAVWPFSRVVLTPAAGRAAVREMAASGYDAIKVYHTLDDATYYAVMDEAEKFDLPVFGHVPFEVGVEEILALGQASIEHFRGYDIDGLRLDVLEIDGGRSPERFASWVNMTDARMDELVVATVEAGTWNCPTFVVVDLLIEADRLEAYGRHPMIEYMPGEFVRRFEESRLAEIFSPASREMLGQARPQMLKFLKKLHDAGANLMTGTDTFPSLVPGFTLIDEIKAFVQAGLTPYQALRAATRSPAEFLDVGDTQGTIAPGMAADLVLLGADPLIDVDNLWAVEGVMANGRWHTRDDLLSELLSIAASPDGARL